MPKSQSLEDQQNAFAIRLLEIDVLLADLNNEREMIVSNISRLQKLQQNFRGTRRKDGIKKALIEECILDFLLRNSKKVRSSDIIAEIEKRTGKVNRSTASSYLKRLENKGLIITGGHGYWVLRGLKPSAKGI